MDRGMKLIGIGLVAVLLTADVCDARPRDRRGGRRNRGYDSSYTYNQGMYYGGQGMYGAGMYDQGTSAQGMYQPGMSRRGYQSNYPPGQGQNLVSTQIQVRLPANAQVFFDEQPTRQMGLLRQYVTPPLPTGQKQTYQIRARWMQAGQPIIQTREVTFTPGERVTVDFTTPQGTAPGGTPQRDTES